MIYYLVPFRAPVKSIVHNHIFSFCINRCHPNEAYGINCFILEFFFFFLSRRPHDGTSLFPVFVLLQHTATIFKLRLQSSGINLIIWMWVKPQTVTYRFCASFMHLHNVLRKVDSYGLV